MVKLYLLILVKIRNIQKCIYESDLEAFDFELDPSSSDYSKDNFDEEEEEIIKYEERETENKKIKPPGI